MELAPVLELFADMSVEGRTSGRISKRNQPEGHYVLWASFTGGRSPFFWAICRAM